MASPHLKHKAPSGRPIMHAGIAAFMATGMVLGSGVVHAVEQGGVTPGGNEQGGVTPAEPAPEQGGVSPAPEAPAPAPAPAPSGPGLVPGPPPGPVDPVPVAPTPPSYDDGYNPMPSGPLHTPRPTAPVKRKVAPPDHIRVGNFMMPVKDLPPLPMKNSDRDKAIVSVNDWSSYTEAEITRFLISVGVPEDEASRQAAAAMIGVVGGGGIGFMAGFTATAIVVGPVAIPVATGIGCAIGSIGGNPVSLLGGCGIGLASGAAVTVAAATGVGAATGTAGAVTGGILGWLLGAGDPGANPKRPKLPWENPGPGKHRQPETVRIVNPEANQYEVHMPAAVAKKSGLPPVDYVVNKRGDVAVNVGGAKVGWSAEQAQAPIKALNSVAPGADRVINQGVRAASRELAKAVPGLDVQWPQEGPARKSGKKSPAKAGRR